MGKESWKIPLLLSAFPFHKYLYFCPFYFYFYLSSKPSPYTLFPASCSIGHQNLHCHCYGDTTLEVPPWSPWLHYSRSFLLELTSGAPAQTAHEACCLYLLPHSLTRKRYSFQSWHGFCLLLQQQLPRHFNILISPFLAPVLAFYCCEMTL